MNRSENKTEGRIRSFSQESRLSDFVTFSTRISIIQSSDSYSAIGGFLVTQENDLL